MDEDVEDALGVSSCRIFRGDGKVVVEIEHPDPRRLRFDVLFPLVLKDEDGGRDDLPLATGLLGLSDGGIPLLARLPSPYCSNVLVGGWERCGKSVLLRGFALSLMLANMPEELQVVCVGGTFDGLAGGRHLRRGPIVDDFSELVGSLKRVVGRRASLGVEDPRLVVLIDDVEEVADSCLEDFVGLVNHGWASGVHVVASVGTGDVDVLKALGDAHFPLRVVGECPRAVHARLLSGVAGSGPDAMKLMGRGDFYVFGGGLYEKMRFQSAYVSGGDARGMLVGTEVVSSHRFDTRYDLSSTQLVEVDVD